MSNKSSNQRLLIAAFLIIAMMAVGAAFIYQEKAHEREAMLTLEAISDLKVRQIEAWRTSQLVFAEAVSRDPYLKRAVTHWAAANNSQLTDELRLWLKNSRRYGEAVDLALVDLSNWRILSTSEAYLGPKPEFKLIVEQAAASRRPVMSELHRGVRNQPHLDVAAPVIVDAGPVRQVIVLQFDAAHYLYPLIQSWPLPSLSAETLLVRRDGQAALFLNELRHRKNTALSFKVPFSERDVIAVKALASGQRGLVKGLDYRGVRVLADIAAIPGSAWIMVSKIDQREALASWRLSRNLLLLVMALVALIGGLLIMERRERDRRAVLEDLLAQERVRRLADERYAAVTRSIKDGIITVGRDGRINLLNAAACRLIGCLADEAVDRDLSAVLQLADIETDLPLCGGTSAILNSSSDSRFFLLSRSGASRPVSLSVTQLSGSDFEGSILTIADIQDDFERQREKELTLKVFSLITAQSDLHALIRELSALLQEWTGCEAVGVRLASADGDYPYYETRGFPPEFVEAERSLCARDVDGQVCRDDCGQPVLECMCGNIIRGRIKPEVGLFSPGGSFWTNSTSRLKAEICAANQLTRSRNRCIDEGYESVALIRLRHGGEALGLLQLNDRRSERFSPGLITFLEGCADQIALALKQRQINAELAKSEARWRQLIEAANEGVWSLNARHETVFVNDRMLAILGYSRTEVMSVTIERFILAEDLPDHDKEMQARCANLSGRYERRFRHKDGHVVVTQVSAVPIIDDDGHFMGSFAMFTDITKRRQAEAALRASEEKFHRAFRDAPMLITISSLKTGQYLDVNERFVKVSGFSAAEAIGRTPLELGLVSAAERDVIQSMIMKDGLVNSFELTFTARGGREVACLFSAQRIDVGGQRHLLAIAEDITRRRQMERELQESSRRFRLLVESSPDGIFVQTDGRVVYSNRAASQIAGGYADYDLVNREVLSIFHPSYSALIKERIRQLNEEKVMQPWLEELVARPDGSTVPVEVSAVPLCYEGQDGALVFMRDISERKKTELEHERLISAIEQATEAIVITDRNGLILYVNPAFEKTSGFSRSEILGQNPRVLQSGEHDQAFYAQMWATLASGRTWEGRFINRRKDGSLYHEEASITPVRSLDGEVVNYVAVKRDITEQLNASDERERLESQLRQAQKMESVGRLAGGVAHDFNNMLMVILGHAEMLLDDENLSGLTRQGINEIVRAANRSSDLTRQLLAFARQQTVSPVKLDLNQAIGNMIKMLKRLIGEDIELSWKPQADLGLVLIDPTQVDQILANLVVNARDAISGAGHVIIETGTAVFDRHYCSEHAGAEPGEYVQLSVSDDGCGIDAQAIDQIFEPFFTTKDVGKGTGLGLATVYGVVKQNGGFVNVYSEPGRGTTFKIYLPRSNGASPTGGAPEPEKLLGGAETILVVEDNPAVLEISRAMLERLGYRVIAVEDPLRALAIAQEMHADIDLLITDVIMPNMNGKELSGRLVEIMPQLKCLFMSGYTAEVIAHHGILDEGVNFIQKPFDISAIDAKVRQIIDA